MKSYRFALVHPSPRNKAESRHNDDVLGPHTLGIEVTVPALAARCGLGNIDPQHDGSGREEAAIELCLGWPLPPEDAYLATIRPDLDSIGGMAVFSLRLRSQNPRGLAAPFSARVAAIAKQDRFAYGPWPGPTRLPCRPREYWGVLEGGSELAPLAAAVANHKLDLAERIGIVERWLTSGEVPAAYRRAVDERAGTLHEAVGRGDVRISPASDGRIAVVEATVEGAVRLGYCLAPVVVALNPAFRFRGGPPHRKFTICQYTKGYVDLPAAAAELAACEPDWGGSATIIGSPQGRGSCLALEAVLAIVERRFGP